jgi:hypothetical protein
MYRHPKICGAAGGLSLQYSSHPTFSVVAMSTEAIAIVYTNRAWKGLWNLCIGWVYSRILYHRLKLIYGVGVLQDGVPPCYQVGAHRPRCYKPPYAPAQDVHLESVKIWKLCNVEEADDHSCKERCHQPACLGPINAGRAMTKKSASLS